MSGKKLDRRASQRDPSSALNDQIDRSNLTIKEDHGASTASHDGRRRQGCLRVAADRLERDQRAAPGPRRDPRAGRVGDRGDRVPAAQGGADAADPAIAPHRGDHPRAGPVEGRAAQRLPARAHPPGAEVRLPDPAVHRGGRRRGDPGLRPAAERLHARRLRAHRHALGRPPDIVAAAQARPLRDVRPPLGRRGHAPVGGRGRRARGAQGHRAPDRRRPPADRLPRLAGRVRRGRGPQGRVGAGLPGGGPADRRAVRAAGGRPGAGAARAAPGCSTRPSRRRPSYASATRSRSAPGPRSPPAASSPAGTWP